jgi:prevent-host-death family protein
MAKPVTIHAAKTRFSELVRRAEAGEEIVIARGDKPVVKIVPIVPPKAPKRQFGSHKGLVALDDAFWDPLTDEELELWGMK